MLTIVAWVVFVPALIWNAVFYCIVFSDLMSKRKLNWFNWTNLWQAALSITVLFVPGVYLFGWF